MNGKKKWKYPVMCICIGILMLFMLSIAVRFCTRQILVKRIGIDNAFMQFVFWDVPAMLDGGDKTVTINWAEKYPFETLPSEVTRNHEKSLVEQKWLSETVELYTQLVNSIEEKIEFYSQELLAGYFQFVKLHNWHNNRIGWTWKNDSFKNILYMQNGYRTYEELERTPAEIKELADSVSTFSDFLKEEGISFYYVNAGSKVNPNDKQLSLENRQKEFTNENGNALLKALSERGVNTLDMREYMLKDGLDWYQSYYRTDHHWTTETGLWAAGVLAEVLNEREGFSFDPLFFDEASYEMTIYEDCFLGGQGRGLVFDDIKKDSYTCILPRFDTDFSVEIPTRGLQLTGSYKDTLYDYENLEDALQYSDDDYFQKPDVYSSVIWRNDALGIVKNKNARNNADKKILMIQDSFGFYSTTYLACDVGEVHMIHLSGFNGSLRAYVKEMQPDVVIVMYCERNIEPIDWNTHSSMFDFR